MDIDRYIRLMLNSKKSMVSKERLFNAHLLVEKAIEENIDGSIVECGTCKGGCLAIMRKTVDSLGSNKKVFGFDAFDHLPPPGEFDGKKSIGRGFKGDLAASTQDVLDAFRMCETNENNVELVPGLFQDTLTNKSIINNIGNISVLRLDGDWYESTKVCLENLYDLVSIGGFIIIDDYGHWEGCKKAVDEFRNDNNITSKMNKTDYTEYWWRKE